MNAVPLILQASIGGLILVLAVLAALYCCFEWRKSPVHKVVTARPSEREIRQRVIDELITRGELPLDVRERLVAKYRINNEQTVAVDRAVCFMPMTSCPRGVKVQLLGPGLVATYGVYDGRDNQWRGWYPVPAKPEGM